MQRPRRSSGEDGDKTEGDGGETGARRRRDGDAAADGKDVMKERALSGRCCPLIATDRALTSCLRGKEAWPNGVTDRVRQKPGGERTVWTGSRKRRGDGRGRPAGGRRPQERSSDAEVTGVEGRF